MRQIYRIIDFLLEPYQHTLIYINDIDRIEEEHLPIIYACLEQSDVVITTFVPDYKSEEFRTPSHLKALKRGVIVPNIYFFGIKPNVGELTYPDGSRGYEDIWIYKLLLDSLASSEHSSIDLQKASDILAHDLYFSKDGPSPIPSDFSASCLASSFEQIIQRETFIEEACQDYSNVNMISISKHLHEYINNGLEPIFYTTDHPSLPFLIDISIEILDFLDLKPCAKRLALLHSSNTTHVNTSSTEFLYFSAPYQYKKHIGILNPDLRAYITYKQRFSLEDSVNVTLADYVHQLHNRIQSTPSDILDANRNKLVKYQRMNRILDLRLIVNFG